MDENKKNGYVAAGIVTFIGIVLLYSGAITIPRINLISIIGTCLTCLGILGFRFPEVGEVLFHWMEKNKQSSSISQNQNKSKNSQQVYTNTGNVTINQTITESKRRK